MRKLFCFLIIAVLLHSCGTTKFDKTTTIIAKGPNLEETTTQLKYGTPLCIDVDNVNTFLMSSISTYTPINFDFKTKAFLDIKIDTNLKEQQPLFENAEKQPVMAFANDNFQKINLLNEKRLFNNELINKISTDSISSDLSRQIIASLLKSNSELSDEIKKLEDKTTILIKENKKLEAEIEFIKNVTKQSQLFKNEFIAFQKHFSNIDKYTSLKNILLNQIKKDSVFIYNSDNFKKRSASTFIAIYGSDTENLRYKNLVADEFSKLENKYIKLVQIYEQLNIIHKNNELKLTGELKDGKNILKFDKIDASFETKLYFEDEMKKTKIINDSLKSSFNRNKIIEEVYAGIDLYDEIKNNDFKTKITSKIIYDDKAEIKPQLKNSKGKVMYEYPLIKVSTYGNWKVNGSAGYFLNFLSDDNFTLRKKIDTDINSKSGVFAASNNVVKHSLGGLLHAYYNFKGSLDAGFSVGLSLNDNANAGFYFGLSAFFTESNRLVITAGKSFIKAKRINTTNLVFNNTTNQLDFLNQSDSEIKFDEIYQQSFFIGITYNLF